ncbi:histidine ammonia-lyase [Acidaminobacter sp. JC074]|uniref:histidine ammonia-lyase n=1 Tax=Acidaminobacter sp. JC074 TaxID=2530199 RepID=UPI001F0E80C6|nr:histidine ammonia-lyase [Acidaminobacter sp. JC074]MCH4891381.1 histidine ammonia-lyase [Acidaminobacter sp. JC074]
MKKIVLDGMNVSIEDIVDVSRNNVSVVLAEESIKDIKASRIVVDKIVADSTRIYGINTGFGKLATIAVSKEDNAKLQKNLIMSHAVGVGEEFSTEVTRAMMALRINALAKGLSGISMETLNVLIEMLNKGVHPIIRQQGSVGASGDLCPLAHMVLPMIGLGIAEYQGQRLSGKEAMEKAGIKTVALKEKEGLALINGTCSMMAVGVLATYDAIVAVKTADIVGALSLEALLGVIDAFDERIHLARPQEGQITSAKNVRMLTEKSQLVTKQGELRLQDSYSLRCMPVVHGAARDALDYVIKTVSIEINSATDNPLIFNDGGKVDVFSGSNFHGEPIAIAMDTLAIAIAEIANISERRLEKLVNPALNNGLPAFLIKNEGLNSGIMMTQFPAAALVSENKVLCHPASVDSIPTSANQEDHVSMGTISARKGHEVVKNTLTVLSLELLAACQALDYREKNNLGIGTEIAYKEVRKKVDFISEDLVLYLEQDKCIELVKSGDFLKKIEEEVEIK